MKKLGLGAVLLVLSGVASATEYTADGFRITQVGTGTIVNVTEISKDGFNTLTRCTEWLQAQQDLALSFKAPNGMNSQSQVHAVCTLKKAALIGPLGPMPE